MTQANSHRRYSRALALGGFAFAALLLLVVPARAESDSPDAAWQQAITDYR